MGSPRHEGLELFIRNTLLSQEEWVKALETRCWLVKPYLNEFTLDKLGNVKALHSEGFPREINTWGPAVVSYPQNEFDLGTQGIFGIQPWQDIEYFPGTGFQGELHRPALDGVVQLWGLTRKAEWLHIEVRFRGVEGYKRRGAEQATQVMISSSRIDEILEKTKTPAEQIWRQLGRFITSKQETFEARYRRVLIDTAAIAAEELALESSKKLAAKLLESAPVV